MYGDKAYRAFALRIPANKCDAIGFTGSKRDGCPRQQSFQKELISLSSRHA